MKGVRRMVIAIASTVMTMACQGCVSTAPHDFARSEPAVPPSLGMSMAVPTALASQNIQADQDATISVHVVEGAPARFSGTVLGALPAPVYQFNNAAPASFGSLSGIVPSDLPELSWTGSPALVAIAAERGKARLGAPIPIEKDIATEIAFSAPRAMTGLKFDVGVAPRIAVRDDGEVLSQRVGGEVRIGRDLNILDKNGQPQGWYIFAGADGEALVWDAGATSFTPNLNDMSLTDQVTVGDMQAGVSIQRAGGELSLSYIRREVKYEDRNGSFSNTEDFAGVSFTMRR
ncbi:MAG: hypothetical protein V7675_02490 [Hyphomonas sp.]|uniref:hypothetical protein n=1 Tax=Hyphomonas sp. TaxID=87 RepID=UPI003002282A